MGERKDDADRRDRSLGSGRGAATEAPLAQVGSPFGRLWNPLDIAASAVVDTVRNGALTDVRHGDSGDLGFRLASGARLRRRRADLQRLKPRAGRARPPLVAARSALAAGAFRAVAFFG